MENIGVLVGQNIKAQRKRLKLTQAQLGAKVGLTLQAINRIEKGTRQPRKSNLEAIAGALGCSVGDLFAPPLPLEFKEQAAASADSNFEMIKKAMASVLAEQAYKPEPAIPQDLLEAWQSASPDARARALLVLREPLSKEPLERLKKSTEKVQDSVSRMLQAQQGAPDAHKSRKSK